MRTSLFVASLLLAMGSLVNAQPADTRAPAADVKEPSKIKEAFTKLTLTNESFVDKAVISGLAEVTLSKLALTKSQDPQIKSFAQQMVTDHTAADTQLKSIAQRHKLLVPAELDSVHEATVDKLRSLSGADFDVAYRLQMKEDHDKAVLLFSAASDDKSLDADLQAFARKTLPILQGHQADAEKLHGKH